MLGMVGPLSRIILRYLVGALVVWGFIDANLGAQLGSDKDIIAVIEIGLGLLIAVAVELYYWAAKHYEWDT